MGAKMKRYLSWEEYRSKCFPVFKIEVKVVKPQPWITREQWLMFVASGVYSVFMYLQVLRWYSFLLLIPTWLVLNQFGYWCEARE